MWSTFVVQDEEARSTAISGRGPEALAGMLGVQTGGGKRRTRASTPSMSDRQEGKIKLVFLLAIVGITLAVLGVGTEFWVELASAKHFYNNETCLAAHYGLWKNCIKKLWVADVDPERETCGPIDLPGESNCTYVKIYTTGENTVLFHKTPAKDLTVISAMLAIFSLFMMMMGAVCIIMAISKGVQFFLKPASVCFTLSGTVTLPGLTDITKVCFKILWSFKKKKNDEILFPVKLGLLVFLSLIIFHQSVLSFLASDHSIPLHHELSWSVACMGFAGFLLIVAGVLFFLLTLPKGSWDKCLSHRNTGSL